jgi:hypothetical protein
MMDPKLGDVLAELITVDDGILLVLILGFAAIIAYADLISKSLERIAKKLEEL